jgi:hypothetical protein
VRNPPHIDNALPTQHTLAAAVVVVGDDARC